MSRPQASAAKRQRELAKREKQRAKAERRALRKSGALSEPEDNDAVVLAEDSAPETPRS